MEELKTNRIKTERIAFEIVEQKVNNIHTYITYYGFF